jgi:hypothetical protein
MSIFKDPKITASELLDDLLSSLSVETKVDYNTQVFMVKNYFTCRSMAFWKITD